MVFSSALRGPRHTRQPGCPIHHYNIARYPSDLPLWSIIMKASMMLTHTEPRPALPPIPLCPQRLIPKPSTATPWRIPPNAQIRKVASPTWKSLPVILVIKIRIRISIQEWSIGYSRWFSHGQWPAELRIRGRRRGRGCSLSQRGALGAVTVAVEYVPKTGALAGRRLHIQVAQTRPRALIEQSCLPYQSKTRN